MRVEPARRRRSARRWAALVLLAVLLLSVPVLYIKYRSDLRPVKASAAAVPFRVESGDNAPKVASNLATAGLIRSRNAFITYVNFHGLRPRLKVGTYSISAAMSAADIADNMANGKILTRRLVVPEGYTLMQIEAEASTLGFTTQSFRAALIAQHSQSFLAGKPTDVDLEGYLFPDSYSISTDTTSSQLVNDMLDNFGSRVGPDYVKAFAAEGLTLHQGVTVASIVEREVNIQADRPVVAQIFLSRLKKGMNLGSDVTACYAYQLAYSTTKCNAAAAITLSSPYNTRAHAGLPPGPIASPGLNSLDAVAHPASTDWLFFFTDKVHVDHFEHTYEQQQQDVAKYGLVGQ